ncbi:DUF2285 domain-containing protein [Shinella sp. NM-101]|uniref:DUF2285 domain-containing protein n=1 Tax=Shinella sp. NM-101 TaxID=2744455 RepID=UPI001F233649|nr:DUF2285 domain-containing protein [Shinella sp. NM-101]
MPGADLDHPLAAQIPLDRHTLDRLGALTRFWLALRGRPVPRDGRLTAQQWRRMKLMLQVSDGRSDGASYRDIAVAIFGHARVAAEAWKTSALRDMVIDLAADGTAMIEGGYRNILRHRRRS